MSSNQYAVVPHGEKFRVLERRDGADPLVLRTLDTRDLADAFLAAIGHNPNKKG